MFILTKPPDPSGHESHTTRSESVARSPAVLRHRVSYCDRAWIDGLFDQYLNGRDKARPTSGRDGCPIPELDGNLVESDIDRQGYSHPVFLCYLHPTQETFATTARTIVITTVVAAVCCRTLDLFAAVEEALFASSTHLNACIARRNKNSSILID